MLEVSLGRLAREGEALLDARIPADDPMWEGFGLGWTGPVEVELRIASAGTGELVARGHVSGALRVECRRCLEPVDTRIDEDVTLVFVEEEEAEEGDTGEVRTFPGSSGSLDLSQALREEIVLAIDPYVVCDAECKGLCPRCGTNLNEGTCSCVDDDPDPRWDALRSLKDK
jgi:uncharacterized protein